MRFKHLGVVAAPLSAMRRLINGSGAWAGRRCTAHEWRNFPKTGCLTGRIGRAQRPVTAVLKRRWRTRNFRPYVGSLIRAWAMADLKLARRGDLQGDHRRARDTGADFLA